MRKFAEIIESTTVAPPTNCLWIKGNDALYFTNGKWVSLLAEDSYTLPKATKTSLGGIKAITNVVDLAEDATTAQVVGVVNTLLKQFRNCGLIQL